MESNADSAGVDRPGRAPRMGSWPEIGRRQQGHGRLDDVIVEHDVDAGETRPQRYRTPGIALPDPYLLRTNEVHESGR